MGAVNSCCCNDEQRPTLDTNTAIWRADGLHLRAEPSTAALVNKDKKLSDALDKLVCLQPSAEEEEEEAAAFQAQGAQSLPAAAERLVPARMEQKAKQKVTTPGEKATVGERERAMEAASASSAYGREGASCKANEAFPAHRDRIEEPDVNAAEDQIDFHGAEYCHDEPADVNEEPCPEEGESKDSVGTVDEAQEAILEPTPSLQISFGLPDGSVRDVLFVNSPFGFDFGKQSPLTVRSVKPGSHAEELGLEAGWKILRVEDKDVSAISGIEAVRIMKEKVIRFHR